MKKFEMRGVSTDDGLAVGFLEGEVVEEDLEGEVVEEEVFFVEEEVVEGGILGTWGLLKKGARETEGIVDEKKRQRKR